MVKDAVAYGGTTEVEVKTLNFNMWVDSPSVFISNEVWSTNTHGIKEDELLGAECYGGLEIAGSSELNCFALLFPGDIVKIKMLFISSEEALKLSEFYRENKAHIKVDPGNVVENDVAIAWIIEEIQKYNMHSFCFAKPQENNSIVQGLIKEGYTGNPISQGLSGIANATDEWEKLLRAGQIEHFGNPILKWMNSNCTAVRKEAGTRLEKNPKVLGIWACLNALSQWKTNGGTEIGILYI
jgi:phage terminase large subunit-like protein